MNDNTSLSGLLHIVVKDSNGNIKEEREIPNLVVTVGKTYLCLRMTNNTTDVMSHMAVGTSGTSPAAGDTTLGAEVARVAFTSTTPSSNTITHVADFPAGTGTGALQEAGLFNAASAGTMLAHTTFSVVNKGAGDTLSISWTITVN